ncbi:hypothetical protein M408DRAFT_5422 [Serendipita vermifera MAFF 305830]|uniref:Tuberous sclerosis 1 n=1 Tax=Serendipita vermifera MAFF 305830 TaxID=933852 RepID=A0A0C2XYW4_SERVB|nr:hypothetical protein M408DRAFT_5422 [Serendipita vermifera MAFF 305830]
MALSLREIEQLIKTAISDRSSEHDATALEAVHAFVSQKPADVPQLESTLEDIYNTKLPTEFLDLFVEMLYIMRDHLTVESIGKVWWDMVLLPALKRKHMSRTCIRHAIAVTMVVMREEGGVFRRRLVLLYILGVPSLNSSEEAIDNASMNEEERAQTERYKSSLVDILTEDAMKHPAFFFEEINHQYSVSAESRLPLIVLLSKLADHEDFPIVEFGNSPILMTLMRSMIIDNSGTLFCLQITVITKLLPYFIVKSQTRLKEVVPELFAILARAICWQSRDSLDPTDSNTDSNTRNLEIRKELNWQRLEHTFEDAGPSNPDAIRYFTFLYGIYPRNCLAFLREPLTYLTEKNCKSPFSDGWAEFLDDEEVQNRCEPLLRHHILHPALVRQTTEEELTSVGTWKKDVSELVKMCTLLDVRSVAGASQSSEMSHLQPSVDAWTEGGEIFTQQDGSSTPMLDRGGTSQTQRRVPVSIRQLMETHMMLRSGLPIDFIDDYSEAPATPRVHPGQIPVYDVAGENLLSTMDGSNLSGPLSPEAMSLTSTQRDMAKDEAISHLQRDLILLMNELNFETYLRRHYLAQIGTLHKRNVQTRSSDRERQRMRDQIKRNEQEIERHKREKREMQNQIDRYREGGDNYSSNMRQQIHKMRQEKAAWLAEAQELRIKDAENKDVLAAQSERLAATETQIFELENEKKESAVKVLLIKDYEKQIELLRKAESVWHADHLKLKRQADIIEQSNAKLFSMQQIIDSEQNANSHLAEQNRYLENRVESLEYELEQARHATKTAQSPELLRHSKAIQKALQAQVSALEAENSKLRLSKSQLAEELSNEQVKREALQNREWQRQNSERLAGQNQ